MKIHTENCVSIEERKKKFISKEATFIISGDNCETQIGTFESKLKKKSYFNTLYGTKKAITNSWPADAFHISQNLYTLHPQSKWWFWI